MEYVYPEWHSEYCSESESDAIQRRVNASRERVYDDGFVKPRDPDF
jgi:hypothetical protein